MSKLRVALDARRLQDRPLGGVGRSLHGVLDLLAADVNLILLTDARRAAVDTSVEQWPIRTPAHAPELVWIQCGVPWRLRGFDGVLHGTFNQLPFRVSVPAVVTIHDLSFELHPEGFTRAKQRAFQLQARRAARVAGRIIAPSNATKDELVACYRVHPDRIVVTPWPVDPRFDPAHSNLPGDFRRRLGLTGRYIVAMGGTPRRGLGVAVEAWRRVRDTTGIDLVVVGSERVDPEPGLVDVGRVDDRDWPALLAGADAFCYPTRYEGFGIPGLESIASGTPVVCARVGSLPEVLGNAAEWCGAPTPDSIAAGLLRVLTDPERAAQLRERGLARAAAQPSWEQTADAMLRAYRDTYRT
jgi:glycosyltransferase involved in cell wall biosynthesis